MSHFGLSLKQQISTRLEQKLVITPQLQQAIKLLQLNHVELQEMLEEELLENPMLEMGTEDGEDGQPNEQEASPEASEKQEAAAGADETTAQVAEQAAQEALELEAKEESAEVEADPLAEIDWEAYFEDTEFKLSTIPSSGGDYDPDLPSLESRLAPEASLLEHLEWQLNLMRVTKDVRNMAMLIIGHLDHRGWLVIEGEKDNDPLEVLARQITKEEKMLRAEQLADVSEEERQKHWYECAVKALEAVQQMEPVGVGARSLQECLLLQCQQLTDLEDPDLVDRLLRDHLVELEKKKYNTIGKKIKISLNELVAAEKVIAQLDPHPTRAFGAEPTAYITPDIYIEPDGSDYKINLNDDGMPKLRINAIYKRMIKDQDKEKREYIQEKLRNATWLLRSIHQRQQTIYKVTESIIKRQKDFFDSGVQYLKPMILRDVALDIGMHESTISRVTTNKYVHTPQGVYELKFFFTSSLQSSKGGDDVSSLTVKEKIKDLVAGEDLRKPLSDQAIVKILKTEGIKIARRTVAKYRGILDIPPSNQRKKMF